MFNSNVAVFLFINKLCYVMYHIKIFFLRFSFSFCFICHSYFQADINILPLKLVPCFTTIKGD